MIISLSIVESIALYCTVFLISAIVLKSKIKSKYKKLILALILPFFLAGLRYNVGWDYGSYSNYGYDLFNQNVTVIELLKNYQFGDSLGLNLVLLLSKSLNSKFLFFAITGLLSAAPVFLYLLNEWDDEKNIILVATFVACFSVVMSGFSMIKQGIAISFCVYSMLYVNKRKPLGFAVCMVIAFMFHSTALIFIPVYFFWSSQNKIGGWKNIFIIISSVLFDFFWVEILAVFDDGRFAKYGTEVLITNNYSFYLMVFWLCVYFIFRKKLIELDKRNELLIIMYSVAVILMILGFRSPNTKRIASYFEFGQIMLLPQLTIFFDEKNRKFLELLVCLYMVAIFIIYNKGGTADNMSPLPYSIIFYE